MTFTATTTRRELLALAPLVALVGLRALTDTVGVKIAGVGPNDLVGLGLIGYAGVLMIVHRRLLVRGLAAAAVGAVWAAIGTAEFGTVPWIEWVRMLSVLSVAIVAILLRGPITVRSAAFGVQIVAAIPALVATVQLITGTGIDIQGDVRSIGTLAHPNTAGLLMAIAVLCAFIRLAQRRTWFDIALGALSSIGLLSTLSFGSIGALLAMALVFLLSYRPFSIKLKLIVVAVIVLAPLAVVLSPIGQQRLAGLGLEDGADRGSAVDSISWRFEAWYQLWLTHFESPVFGRGLGATTAATIVSDNLPHNEYLRALIELGWVGVVLLGFAVTAGLVLTVRLARLTSLDPILAPTVYALAAGVAVSSFVANTFLYTVPMYAAALLLGAAARQLGESRARP